MNSKIKIAISLAFLLALVGIAAVVGYEYLKKQKHDLFHEQVEKFQGQTAVWDKDKMYTPGATLQAVWTFQPIMWETPVTMEATFVFVNTDTGQQFLSGEFRSLPFFNQLQYQVSKPLGFQPDAKRELTSSYRIPPQVISGNYKILICQRFEHDGYKTAYSCYDGPTFTVKRTPTGS